MNNIYKDIRLAVILSLIIAGVLIVIRLIIDGDISFAAVIEPFIRSAFYGIPLSLGNIWLFEYLNKTSPWHIKPRKRAIVGIILSVFLTLTILIVLNLIDGWVIGEKVNLEWIRMNRLFYLVGFIITIIVTITLHAIGFFREVQKEKVLNTQLQKEKLSIELNALRTQVNPHFLFNSFNVLSGLIDEDQDKAQKFLTRLSSIYRYILEQKSDPLATVKEELQFASNYLNLQKMRFEESIDLHVDVEDSAMDRQIPSLSLQMLLENAVKHNGFDIDHPLHISITSQNQYLEVKNNVTARSTISSGNGIGLKNISENYRLYNMQDILIDIDDNYFKVKLPLI